MTGYFTKRMEKKDNNNSSSVILNPKQICYIFSNKLADAAVQNWLLDLRYGSNSSPLQSWKKGWNR